MFLKRRNKVEDALFFSIFFKKLANPIFPIFVAPYAIPRVF